SFGVRGHPGPLARMAIAHGFPRVAWLCAGLLLAPTVEELLFRGVLYGGLRQSLGACWAAVLMTLAFLGLHFDEIGTYVPAIVSLALLALTTLWCRLHYGAVGA